MLKSSHVFFHYHATTKLGEQHCAKPLFTICRSHNAFVLTAVDANVPCKSSCNRQVLNDMPLYIICSINLHEILENTYKAWMWFNRFVYEKCGNVKYYHSSLPIIISILHTATFVNDVLAKNTQSKYVYSGWWNAQNNKAYC